MSLKMTFMRGEPLVAKMAALAKYAVLPGAMVTAFSYSPQQDPSSSKKDGSSKP